MTETRKIVGVQLHHSVAYQDATRGLVNARAGLRSAMTRTGESEIEEIDDLIAQAQRRTRKLQEAAEQRLRDLWDQDPERFRRCRDGVEAWPDEIDDGARRCTCYDRCRVHWDWWVDEDKTEHADPRDVGGIALAESEGWRCQCAPCPVEGH